jgi:hypothetical protein
MITAARMIKIDISESLAFLFIQFVPNNIDG